MGFTNWQERAEKAEAELAKLAKQEPVTFVIDFNGYAIGGKHTEIANALPVGMDLYAAPVPAVAAPADLLNKLSIVLSGEMVFDPPAHLVDAIPETWDDWDKSIYKKYLREAANSWGRRKIIMQARALLQSAPQAPTVPDDRVSQDDAALMQAASALALFRAGESAEYMAKAIEALLQSTEVTK